MKGSLDTDNQPFLPDNSVGKYFGQLLFLLLQTNNYHLFRKIYRRAEAINFLFAKRGVIGMAV